MQLARLIASFNPYLFQYINAYAIKVGSVYGTLEPKLRGDFTKYLNNSMDQLLIGNEMGLKAAAFAHYSLVSTNHEFLVTDCQGG